MTTEITATTFQAGIEKRVSQKLAGVPDRGEEREIINLYPDLRYQRFYGFGGAMTESAAYVYSLMTQEQKQQLIRYYYGSDGMNYQAARIPIDSCDFSLSQYEADSDPEDVRFRKFSLDRPAEYIFPMLDDAQNAHGGNIELTLSPWSPPAYMKTNGERSHGGSVDPKFRSCWAEYICKYILLLKKHGYLVKRLTIQNEPKAVQTWDSCVYSAKEEKDFLRDNLYPALLKNNLVLTDPGRTRGKGDISLYIWDHNKERIFERACQIIDETTDAMIDGIAFHWYSGDHFDALRMVRDRFPDKELMLSEACIEYSRYGRNDFLCNAQKYAHEIIGNINAGMNRFIDWNLVLDEDGGPNHVGNYCDAPFLYDRKKGKLMKQCSASYIWHFSHFISPGAVRIGSSIYTDQIESCSLMNPGDRIVTVMLNRGKRRLPVHLRERNEMVTFELPPESITTAVTDISNQI